MTMHPSLTLNTLSGLLGAILTASMLGCGSTPTLVDAGVSAGSYAVTEWYGIRVTYSTDVTCTLASKKCRVRACIWLPVGDPICYPSEEDIDE